MSFSNAKKVPMLVFWVSVLILLETSHGIPIQKQQQYRSNNNNNNGALRNNNLPGQGSVQQQQQQQFNGGVNSNLAPPQLQPQQQQGQGQVYGKFNNNNNPHRPSLQEQAWASGGTGDRSNLHHPPSQQGHHRHEDYKTNPSAINYNAVHSNPQAQVQPQPQPQPHIAQPQFHQYIQQKQQRLQNPPAGSAPPTDSHSKFAEWESDAQEIGVGDISGGPDRFCTTAECRNRNLNPSQSTSATNNHINNQLPHKNGNGKDQNSHSYVQSPSPPSQRQYAYHPSQSQQVPSTNNNNNNNHNSDGNRKSIHFPPRSLASGAAVTSMSTGVSNLKSISTTNSIEELEHNNGLLMDLGSEYPHSLPHSHNNVNKDNMRNITSAMTKSVNLNSVVDYDDVNATVINDRVGKKNSNKEPTQGTGIMRIEYDIAGADSNITYETIMEVSEDL